MTTLAAKLSSSNETTWMRLGALSELMHDTEKALYCYENAIRHSPYNIKALTQAASICRMREQYPKAVDYFQRILNIENNNGEIWGALGHCYLMMDDLQKAYTAYQQALYHLPNPKDPNLWYGIGILYDRYGSFEHAEEAFTAVLKMDNKFEKANEIYFRLGIIYKQQMKHEQALDCFKYILQKPPRPLVQADIWFQIGHVHELQKEFQMAKDAYERVLKENPSHAKVLQQLGWLYHHNPTFGNQDTAIAYLMRSIDSDPSDGQTWYLLGRCYMAQQKFRKAYDAYQQAVYRDGRNPTFWCSIGVLYYQINQYRDALDAYSRAIRLNPYLSEVWYDLGTLYESCNNQISDALDAYQRAAELDPHNKHIQQRLSMLRAQLAGGGTGKAAGQKEFAAEQDEVDRPGDMPDKGSLAPRTMEPLHGPSEGGMGLGGSRRPHAGAMLDNIGDKPSMASNAKLPDIVDLSRGDDEKPSLPPLSDAKSAHKSSQEEAPEESSKRSLRGSNEKPEEGTNFPALHKTGASLGFSNGTAPGPLIVNNKEEKEHANAERTESNSNSNKKEMSDDYYDRESDGENTDKRQTKEKNHNSGLQGDDTHDNEPQRPPRIVETQPEKETNGRSTNEEGEEFAGKRGISDEAHPPSAKRAKRSPNRANDKSSTSPTANNTSNSTTNTNTTSTSNSNNSNSNPNSYNSSNSNTASGGANPPRHQDSEGDSDDSSDGDSDGEDDK